MKFFNILSYLLYNSFLALIYTQSSNIYTLKCKESSINYSSTQNIRLQLNYTWAIGEKSIFIRSLNTFGVVLLCILELSMIKYLRVISQSIIFIWEVPVF